jgi:hypothetical protein
MTRPLVIVPPSFPPVVSILNVSPAMDSGDQRGSNGHQKLFFSIFADSKASLKFKEPSSGFGPLEIILTDTMHFLISF